MPMASRHKPNVEFLFMFVSSSLPARDALHELFKLQTFIDDFKRFWWCHYFFLSQIFFFSASPLILKVNKESTFCLHREIFIWRIQLFILSGKSRNLQLLIRWNEINSKYLPLESQNCHKPTALSALKKSPPVNKPPIRSKDTFQTMDMLILFHYSEFHCVPFQIPETLLQPLT